jgi:hypothetical protein
MVLVTIGTIYTDLNIDSIRGKPIDIDPLLYSRIQQQVKVLCLVLVISDNA